MKRRNSGPTILEALQPIISFGIALAIGYAILYLAEAVMNWF